MTREDIEKACQQGVNTYLESNNLMGFVGSYKKGFHEAVEWRINSVWHDASEKPKLGELIIVEVYGKIWDYGKYDVCDTIHPKARWAYMKDLIPTKD